MSVTITKKYPVNMGVCNGMVFTVLGDNSEGTVGFMPGVHIKGCIAMAGTDTLGAAHGVLNSDDGTENSAQGYVEFATVLPADTFYFLVLY